MTTAPVSPAVDTPHARVFLSYSRKDADEAMRLRQHLEDRGFEVFRDVDDTLPGEEWWQRLTSLIAGSDTVLFLLSANSSASTVCRDEVHYASQQHKRILPVALEAVDWSSVPDGLARIHGITVDNRDIAGAADHVAGALVRDVDWLRTHTRLAARAARWLARERDPSELLTGRALIEAEHWLARQPPATPAPTPLHFDHVNASRAAEREAAEHKLAEITRQQRALEIERDRVVATLEAAGQTATTLINGLVQRLRNSAGISNELVKRVLDKTNGLLHGLQGADGAMVSLELERIRALHLSVPGLCDTGRLAEADAAAQEAVEAATRLAASHPTDEQVALHLAQVLGDVGTVRRTQGRPAEALARYRELLRLCQSPAIARADKTWPVLGLVAASRAAELHAEGGQLEEAYEAARAAFAFYKQVHDKQATAARDALATAYLATALYAERGGDRAAALEYCESAQSIRAELAAALPQDLQVRAGLSDALIQLGAVHVAARNLVDGLEAYEEAADIRKQLAAQDSTNAAWQFRLAEAMLKVADVAMAEGKTAFALEQFAEVTIILRQLTALDPGNSLWKRSLAYALAQQGRDRRTSADKAACRQFLTEARRLLTELVEIAGNAGPLKKELDQVTADFEASSKSTRRWFG